MAGPGRAAGEGEGGGQHGSHRGGRRQRGEPGRPAPPAARQPAAPRPIGQPQRRHVRPGDVLRGLPQGPADPVFQRVHDGSSSRRPSAPRARCAVDRTVLGPIPICRGDLRFGQVQVEAEHQHLTLPRGQLPERPQDRAALFRGQHSGFRGNHGERRVRQPGGGRHGRGPAVTAQLRAAAVQHRRPHIGQRLAGIGQLLPAPVQAGERLLHDVLGRLPLAEHEIGQPDQPQRVGLVQRGHAGVRLRRRLRPGLGSAASHPPRVHRGIGVHVPYDPGGADPLLPGGRNFARGRPAGPLSAPIVCAGRPVLGRVK